MKIRILALALLLGISLPHAPAQVIVQNLIYHVDQNGPITDAGVGNIPALTSFTFTVSNAPTVLSDLDFRLSILHSHVADLFIELVSPFGTTINLVGTPDGGGNNFQDTYFDEEGGVVRINSLGLGGNVFPDLPPWPGPEYTWTNPNTSQNTNGIRYKPEIASDSFNQFYGENPNGIWTLRIQDLVHEDEGFLLKNGDSTGPLGWGTAIGTQLIIPIPEPSLWALVAGGSLLFLAVRRKISR